MPKRSASDAGLEPTPSTSAAANAIESAGAVNCQRLLDIVSSWEEQSTRSQSDDPSRLEKSKNMVTYLRAQLDEKDQMQGIMASYSEEEAKILEKAMTTKMSRIWNVGTHLRVAKVTNKLASKREKEYYNSFKEVERKRAKKWPKNKDCHGCGCGQKQCSSCWEGFDDYPFED